MKSFSVVIPVYKSDESLKIIALQMQQLQEKMDSFIEIIFVNDSPLYIPTIDALKLLAHKYSFVTVITLRKNQGQHTATLVGLKYATGDYVITMDDDLQQPVSEIPKLIDAIKKNATLDAIFAISSYRDKKASLWRRFASYCFVYIDTLFLERPKGLVKSTFRIMTKDLATYLARNYNAKPSVSSLIINSTHNVENICVRHEKRMYGGSNYSLRKLFSLALSNTIYYSSFPLRLIGILGFVGFLFSLFFILHVLFNKLFFGISIPGYASTVTLISFFGGLNLLAIGIIGEYLLRIIKEQNKLPLTDLIRQKNEE